jgi:hypothetical protein
MTRKNRISFRVSDSEKKYLEELKDKNGFQKLSQYIVQKLLEDQEFIRDSYVDFRYARMSVRGFRCDEAMWDEIHKKSDNPSQFIRDAIKDKLQQS